jgi:hypothetical protein
MKPTTIEQSAHRTAVRHLVYELEVRERRIRMLEADVKQLRKSLDEAYGELALMAKESR